MLDLVGLEAVAGQRVGRFSLGMGQRLGIAAALLGDPPVVVLDEPVNGLDPEGIRWMRTLARQLADRGPHGPRLQPPDVGDGADRRPPARRSAAAGCSPTARWPSSSPTTPPPTSGCAARARRGRRPAARPRARRRRHDDELRVQGLDAAAIGELVGTRGLLLHELTLVRSSLEDAFMTLTADSVEYAATDRPGAGTAR